MSSVNLLLVFAGGGLGAMLRYMAGLAAAARFDGSFPMGTLIINVLGSLGIGLIIGIVTQRDAAPQWSLFLATGMMGGFTTFSAFALETVRLMESGEAMRAIVYVALSILCCVIACTVGLKLAGTLA